MGLFQDTQALAQDYQVAGRDRGQTVTYTPADGTAALTITLATYTELTVEEVTGSEGLFALGDRRWTLGADQLGTRQPVEGDKITDIAGVVWFLTLEIVQDSLGARWVVHTRRSR